MEDVVVTIDRPRQPDVLRLDRDSALTLDIHLVEVLRTHLASVDQPGDLQHPIGEGRLAVVDVRDDAEVADPLRIRLHIAGGTFHRGMAAAC